jgi:pilus assembly protein CpaB
VSRRGRGLALLGAALACAGLAASSVSRYTNEVRAQVGPLVSVAIAVRDIPAGHEITPAAVGLRRVPERYVPPGAIRDPAQVSGSEAALAIRAGDYINEPLLATDRDRAGAPAPSGRIVELSVAGASSIADALRPGERVDVLITTDRGAGGGRTYLALQNAELIAFAGQGDKAFASLRVTLRQAVLLTAAQSFARELRLVPRPPGDRGEAGPVSVSAAELGR